MARKKKFVDLPVTKEVRELVKQKKGKKGYDQFLREVLNFNFTGDQS